ncbi:GlsB/YeaQ/YmgE family stress response membrane protein [Saccharopolyspora shandongensis]|uniref:GlsB/YeaQ/YmgE family stress response membrane protein n=1 Tax=Saccharopolyspora shandongensis TaxID=418495 RepID=UPI00342B4000
MGILSWILFGLIAGAIAKFILPGKDPGGIIVTILIGIAGGLLGGWLGSSVFGSAGISGFNLMSFVWAVIGALILLAVYRLAFHKTRGIKG